jgi:S-adenosylmethionine:tRNA ribosyltransferase-isomerase
VSHSIEDYDYFLPDDLIAQKPAASRDGARLLVVHRAEKRWEHVTFSDLPKYLDGDDLCIANDTRVLRARLQGKRILGERGGATDYGGKVEFLMLEEHGPRQWEGAFHASARHKPGVEFEVPTPDGKGLRGVLVRGASESASGTVVVEFDRDPVESGAGEIPLPHYIDRPAGSDDEARYQTIYARALGSAAAPTAGLHFTDQTLAAIRARGAQWSTVTLHVGLGTFRPVKTPDIREHVMHEERYRIEADTAQKINEWKKAGKRVVAIGTTSARALESSWDESGVRAGEGRTSLFLYPGGRPLHVVDRLFTNFHLPKSTLLMLVSAFAGRELVLEVYKDAVKKRYRFFSYGDAMLVL